MSIPLPPHPNVRNCTHIKVTGQRCGSPALRGEFFCYFHTRAIKGVQQRVDMRLDSMALLEDHEAIQFSLMNVVDGLVKGTLDFPRARLILQALRIAARNANNVRFDQCYDEKNEQKMVREIPNYARQYLIEHPELGPEPCGAGAPPAKTKACVARTFLSARPRQRPPSNTKPKPRQSPSAKRRIRQSYCNRMHPRQTQPQNQPRSGERMQPTAQAVGQE